MSKYYNKKIEVDGIIFDSKKEAKRYKHLKELEKQGLITNLCLQPKFLLQDKFSYKGKTYRKIEYVADFSYIIDDKYIIEDVKGIKTDVFKLKQKLFLKVMIDKGIDFVFQLV